MSTPNLNLESVQNKIEQAKQYSNIIKDSARLFNGQISTIIRQSYGDIAEAVRLGGDIDYLLNDLMDKVRQECIHIIERSIETASAREGQDSDTNKYILPLAVQQCSMAYYEDTLNRYMNILKSEIEFAIEGEYIDDMFIFLSNPQGYMSGIKGGLYQLKNEVSDIKNGISYSFSDNMKKLGISIAALAYANAELYIWKSSGNIVGYFGVRNSNFPCALCDMYAHLFFPISQGMVYPLHNRCVCAIVPLTQNEIL